MPSSKTTVNFTLSDKSMGMYELNKKIAIARGNGYLFDHVNKLTKKDIVIYQI